MELHFIDPPESRKSKSISEQRQSVTLEKFIFLASALRGIGASIFITSWHRRFDTKPTLSYF